MSQTRNEPQADQVPEPGRPLAGGARIDPPHVGPGRTPPERDSDHDAPFDPFDDVDHVIAEVSEDPCDPLVSDFALVRAQAQQLASHLRHRQHDLDRRETQLHKQLADLDNDLRAARLWLDEERYQLTERSQALDLRQQELEAQWSQRATDAANVEAVATAAAEQLREQHQTLARQREELTLEREQLAQLKIDLTRQRSELERQSEKLAREIAALEEHRAQAAAVDPQAVSPLESPAETPAAAPAEPLPERVAEREAALDAQEKRLAEAEALLSRGREDLLRLQNEAREERERQEAQAKEDRRRLAEHQRRQEAELSRQRQALARQSEQLDLRRLAVQQSHAEVTRLHRETLELRLATEELWSQLAGATPPAALTQILGQTRQRLAEHYRYQASDLSAQKSELETLAKELATQREQLEQRTREFQTWLAGRQKEIESQAARLVTREQELDRQETEHRQAEAEWHEERFELEQQLRRLLTERTPTAA